ncbi:hypothetical protein DITRI_Ditri13aG0152400 [Diplodiscus trichospermus]
MQEVWTLCRIFKRIPPNKKFAVASTWKLDAAIKENAEDSKTCSLKDDSGNSTEQQCVSFSDSVQQNHIKPNIFMDQVDSRNHFVLGVNPWSTTNGSIAQQASFAANNQPSFWDHPNGVDIDVFRNGNWDELRPVVQLALEPYPCGGLNYT